MYVKIDANLNLLSTWHTRGAMSIYILNPYCERDQFYWSFIGAHKNFTDLSVRSLQTRNSFSLRNNSIEFMLIRKCVTL